MLAYGRLADGAHPGVDAPDNDGGAGRPHKATRLSFVLSDVCSGFSTTRGLQRSPRRLSPSRRRVRPDDQPSALVVDINDR